MRDTLLCIWHHSTVILHLFNSSRPQVQMQKLLTPRIGRMFWILLATIRLENIQLISQMPPKRVFSFQEKTKINISFSLLKIKIGDDKSFNFLVNCGQKVNGRKTIFGIAPIHNAIQFVNTSKDDTILKSVIKCNANLNISDSNGWTSLHHACKNGDLPSVEYLIQNKANISLSSSKVFYFFKKNIF